jgi:sugar-specific transcriptional regulator TrmB
VKRLNQDESSLKSIGLTDYESKAYVTLLKLGSATAEQISEIGNIPLPRVYDTITELEKKGFVLISKGRPKRFKAISPEKALSNLIDLRKKNFENDIKSFRNSIKNISKTLLQIQPVSTVESKQEIWSIEKRKNLQKILEEKEGTSKKEILIFAGDLSWLPERLKSIKGIIRKGIKIKVIMNNPSGETLSYVKKAREIGMNIRTGYIGDLRGDLIDDKLALILKFDLSKGCYATCLLREFMKSDDIRNY